MSVSQKSPPRIVVALDHGLSNGMLEGFENPRRTIESVVEAEPDGILCGLPLVRQFRQLFEGTDIHLIATLDQVQTSTVPGSSGNVEIHHQTFSVAEAARLSADSVKTALVFGRDDPRVQERNLQFVADVCEVARKHDLSSVVETTLWGTHIEDDLDPDLLAHANRLGFELGADILKTFYPGSPSAFKPIAESLPVPVHIAGGPALSDDTEILRMVEGAVDGGAYGVMFGRNIWQHDRPSAIVAAIDSVVRDGLSAEEATRIHL